MSISKTKSRYGYSLKKDNSACKLHFYVSNTNGYRGATVIRMYLIQLKHGQF